MKKLISVLLLAALFVAGVPTIEQPVFAADETVSYLIVGKAEWWKDKSLNTHFVEVVQNGLLNKLNIGNPPHPYIDAEFPAALVQDVNNVYKYEVVGVSIANEGDQVEYSGEISISNVFRYKLEGATLTNTAAIIGQAGTTVSFNSRFQLPDSMESSVYKYMAPNGVNVYRVYVPIKVTFKKVPINASLTVSGVVDPNPSELTPDGSAYPDLTVTATATGIPADDQIIYRQLEYRPEGAADWTAVEDADSGTSISDSWGLTINKDTKISLRAAMRTRNGLNLTATGEVTAYVVAGQGDINADVEYNAIPQILEVTQKDYNNNTPVMFQLEADSSSSTAENGIGGRLYYYKLGAKPYEYSAWTNQQIYTKTVSINPKDADGSLRVNINGRVAIRDTKGFVAYASDQTYVQLVIVASPPETTLSGPDYMLPREVGLPNTFSWTYTSPDGTPYDHSEVSVERMAPDGEWMPVITDQVQTDRTLNVEGDEYELYRVSVRVFDTNGNKSEISSLIREVVSSRPVIEVDAVDNGPVIDVAVTDKTVPEIRGLFPTQYSSWSVINYQGAVIDSGSGKLPGQFDNDSRFTGGAVTFVQLATNALGRTGRGQDTLPFNSQLDFSVVPNVLFETQLAELRDQSKYLQGKTRTIKATWQTDADFAALDLDVENKFTRDAGEYNVKVAGMGYLSDKYSIWQYSNDRTDLVDNRLPATPSADIVKTFAGDQAVFASGSATFSGSIHQSLFYSGGTEYKFRRQVDYYATSPVAMQDIKNVTFKNGTPVAALNVTGTKQYRAIGLDLAPSSAATDPELQAAFPVQYADPRTYVEVTYLKDGQPDRTKNDKILGVGRQVVGEAVRFSGSSSYQIRIDEPGTVEIRAVVHNTLKPSAAYVHQRSIDEDSSAHVEVSLLNDINYRSPELQLATVFHVTVDHQSLDGDAVDLDKSKLLISYDRNNNGNYQDDGADSSLEVSRSGDNLPGYITNTAKNFTPTRTTASFKLDNATKNVLGRFRISFRAVDAPAPDYLDVPPAELPVISNDPASSAVVFLSDNRAPVVDFKLIKSVEAHITIVDTPGSLPYDIPYLLEQAKLNNIKLTIQHVDVNGVESWHYNWQ